MAKTLSDSGYFDEIALESQQDSPVNDYQLALVGDTATPTAQLLWHGLLIGEYPANNTLLDHLRTKAAFTAQTLHRAVQSSDYTATLRHRRLAGYEQRSRHLFRHPLLGVQTRYTRSNDTPARLDVYVYPVPAMSGRTLQSNYSAKHKGYVAIWRRLPSAACGRNFPYNPPQCTKILGSTCSPCGASMRTNSISHMTR